VKKILLINWRDIKNPEAGGAEIYYHEIFRRCAAKEFSVTVLAHYFKGALREETVDGIMIVRCGGKFLFNLAIIPYLLRNRRAYDLVIEDLNKIPFFTPLYLKPPRLHLAMHFFGVEIFRETLFPAALYVYLMEKCASVIYRKERFIAISRSTAYDLERFPVPRENISIIEPGIDTTFYRPSCKKTSPPVIVHVGRLMKYKNIQFVIACLPRLLEKIPGCTLEIGGYGDYLHDLQRIAAQLHISDQVKFLGKISEEEKRDLLSKATLFVNPSSKEGWGINNIEANLCGTISLSSNVPGLRDSVIDGVTGLLYTPGNQEDFCEKALSILHDATRRTAMEQAAVKRAFELDWNSIAEKMASVLAAS
jgi:glycosyltransferase involved in cell wall biosynthesis